MKWNENISPRIWTRVTDSISYQDNRYIKRAFIWRCNDREIYQA